MGAGLCLCGAPLHEHELEKPWVPPDWEREGKLRGARKLPAGAPLADGRRPSTGSSAGQPKESKATGPKQAAAGAKLGSASKDAPAARSPAKVAPAPKECSAPAKEGPAKVKEAPAPTKEVLAPLERVLQEGTAAPVPAAPAVPQEASASTPKATAVLAAGFKEPPAKDGSLERSGEEDVRPAGPGAGGPDKLNLRKIRIEVAESNYSLRNKWNVPRTVYVAYSKCEHAQVERAGRNPLVTFSGWSTADALLHFARSPDPGQNQVCGLNFANGVRVGGGYKTGASAQEEDLCRRLPNLYTTLNNAKRDGHYPFGPSTCTSADQPEKYSDVLVTPGLVVARLGEQQGYGLLQPAEQAKNVLLVTAAAPNVNFAKEVYDLKLMYNTVRAVFIAPRLVQPETKVLVLGAWGCGAFGGDPTDISRLFAQALTNDDLGQLYQEVHFAIPRCGPGDRNADVFRETFRALKIAFKELEQ